VALKSLGRRTSIAGPELIATCKLSPRVPVQHATDQLTPGQTSSHAIP
jgi:hypothetical protein